MPEERIPHPEGDKLFSPNEACSNHGIGRPDGPHATVEYNGRAEWVHPFHHGDVCVKVIVFDWSIWGNRYAVVLLRRRLVSMGVSSVARDHTSTFQPCLRTASHTSREVLIIRASTTVHVGVMTPSEPSAFPVSSVR